MPRLLAVCFLALALLAPRAQAAEPEMVGVLAVALEADVAAELGLSDDQLGRLREVIDQREMKGMARAMKLARLPREERVAQFADFRAESERLGLVALNEEQKAKLRQIAAKRDDPAFSAEAPAAAEPTAPAAEPQPPAAPEAAPVEPPQPAAEAETPAEPAAEPPSEAPVAAEPAPRAEAPPAKPIDDGKLSFNFQQQPWNDVIRWFADRAELSLVVDDAPPGTLNYQDDRRYTPAEALDVLNGVLLTKGYTLVRKNRMLLVINLEEDYVPPNVVTDVPLDQLDQRGEYELIRVLIQLGDVDPGAAADSLERLTGPQGAVVVLPEAQMLQVTETAGRIRTMLSVVKAMQRAVEPIETEKPELRSYSLGGSDPDTTLAVIETLIDVPLATDQQTGSLIALATPDEHAAIDQALEKLRTEGRQVAVIPVEQIDPFTAASLAIQLFNPVTDAKAKPDPNAPVIQADRLSEAVLVRGTTAQITQVRDLVTRLDQPLAGTEPGARGTVRNLPLSGLELEQALQRVDVLWPSLRANPLRMTSPTDSIPSFRPGAEVEWEQFQYDDGFGDGSGFDNNGDFSPPRSPERRDTTSQPIDKRTSQSKSDSPFRFASDGEDDAAPAPVDPILISPGIGSTMIASRDVEALDALEELLALVANSQSVGSRQYAVFYLKFSDAATVAGLLDSIFGGGGGSGGGSLLGDLAGAAVGGEGGDMIGDLLGMAGGSDAAGFSSVSVDIVPDVRLNALYIYATPADLETVNQLLRVIDQPRGPDRIESIGVPRLIRVINTEAEEVAEVVKQVFADRIGSGGADGQPSPQEFLKAISGGDSNTKEQEPDKMTIGVDERSNSLVVRASEPLFEEVETLVRELDKAGVERPVSTRVVSLRNTSSTALRETLVSLLGEKAVVGAAAAAQQAASGGAAGGKAAEENDAAKQRAQQQQQIRQRFEQMQQMRRAFERNQGGGGGRGGARGGGRGGGGGGRGR